MKGLLSILFLLLARNSVAQVIKTDLQQQNLHGDIDSVIITKFTQLNGEPVVKFLTYMEVLKFNKRGNIAEELLYSNRSGNMSKTRPPDRSIEKPEKTVYKYNKQAKLIEKITYWGNGTLWFRKSYVNDSVKNEQQELSYDIENNKVTGNNITKYTTDGNVKEEDYYNVQDSSLSFKLIFHYDNGNLASVNTLNKSGKGDYNETWTYDQFDNMTSHTKLYTNANNTFNPLGNTTYVYKGYDKQLNWLYMEELNEENMIIFTTKREIFYHHPTLPH